MTGRSDPSHCRPSAVQAAFLDALASPGVRVLRTNFPWVPDDGALAAPVPLVRASLANARQYLGSRRESWRERHRPALERLAGRAPRTVLICGSCGLELLANLRARPATLDRLHVLALGPVARRRPAVRELVIVRGRDDRVSGRGLGAADHVVGTDHLGYLEDADSLSIARTMVARVVDEVVRPAGGTT